MLRSCNCAKPQINRTYTQDLAVRVGHGLYRLVLYRYMAGESVLRFGNSCCSHTEQLNSCDVSTLFQGLLKRFQVLIVVLPPVYGLPV